MYPVTIDSDFRHKARISSPKTLENLCVGFFGKTNFSTGIRDEGLHKIYDSFIPTGLSISQNFLH